MVDLPSGITQLRLPLTGIALSHINSYLLRGDDGYILVDCGWDMPDVLEALQAGMADAGVSLGDIRALVVTHMHADHYGLAGTLLKLGHMRLLMHRIDWVYLKSQHQDIEARRISSESWLARNGFRPSATNEAAFEAFNRLTLVAPDEELEDADRIRVTGSNYQVIWTPGHTPGHICLFDAERHFLLSGDHVLEPITPNVSLWHDGLGNPLGAFLDSLRKVAALDADLVLPAHGEPFLGLQRRVNELLAHHDEREAAVEAALDGHQASAADVAAALPWTRRRQAFADLAVAQQRMALTETLSHLEHLRDVGRAQRREHDGTIYYTRQASGA
jgi:glyoxylase-like metal-dependent hydrolase (beta-lactamase superfamily II)